VHDLEITILDEVATKPKSKILPQPQTRISRTRLVPECQTEIAQTPGGSSIFSIFQYCDWIQLVNVNFPVPLPHPDRFGFFGIRYIDNASNVTGFNG